MASPHCPPEAWGPLGTRKLGVPCGQEPWLDGIRWHTGTCDPPLQVRHYSLNALLVDDRDHFELSRRTGPEAHLHINSVASSELSDFDERSIFIYQRHHNKLVAAYPPLSPPLAYNSLNGCVSPNFTNS
jgi:hypothetical protein